MQAPIDFVDSKSYLPDERRVEAGQAQPPWVLVLAFVVSMAFGSVAVIAM